MTASHRTVEKKQFRRLPGNVKPCNYNIHQKLDQEKLGFVGDQKINVNVSQQAYEDYRVFQIYLIGSDQLVVNANKKKQLIVFY